LELLPIIGNVYIDLCLRSLLGLLLFLGSIYKFNLVPDFNDFIIKIKSSRRLF